MSGSVLFSLPGLPFFFLPPRPPRLLPPIRRVPFTPNFFNTELALPILFAAATSGLLLGLLLLISALPTFTNVLDVGLLVLPFDFVVLIINGLLPVCFFFFDCLS